MLQVRRKAGFKLFDALVTWGIINGAKIGLPIVKILSSIKNPTNFHIEPFVNWLLILKPSRMPLFFSTIGKSTNWYLTPKYIPGTRKSTVPVMKIRRYINTPTLYLSQTNGKEEIEGSNILLLSYKSKDVLVSKIWIALKISISASKKIPEITASSVFNDLSTKKLKI